jgi:putative ABC transport system substrate-binding protein
MRRKPARQGATTLYPSHTAHVSYWRRFASTCRRRRHLEAASFHHNDCWEARWAHGRPELLPHLTQELIQLRPAILVATARPSIEAARSATTTIPILANDLESDPVASGYVESLAHPGGNLTGLFLDAPTLCGKWLQQIGDIVPNVSKVAALWDATTGMYQLDAIKAAVKARSIDLVVMEFRDNDGLEAALKSGLAQGPQAVIQLGSPLTRQAGARTAEILSARRIPGISQFRTFPDGGGLMSYGPDLIQLYRRTGAFVSKILHGARPADLPIERPTKFERRSATASIDNSPGGFLLH